MRKLHFALLLTSFSLLITSCQKTGTKVEVVNPDHNNQEKDDSSNGIPAGCLLVEINCNNGCTVKEKDASGYQTNFKQYYKANTEKAEFTFSKTSDDVEYPSLIATSNEGQAKYEYNAQTGSLKVEINKSYETGANRITLEAAAPTVEFTFSGVDSNSLPVSLQCEGTIKAIDFGGGNIMRNISTLPINNQVAITGGVGSVKVYGACNSFSLLRSEDIDAAKTYTFMDEIHLNHSIKTLDFNLFTVTSNLKKLYIGSDIEEVKYPSDFDAFAIEGRILFTNLEEVVVSKDNRHFDSRDNCGCLIDSATSELIIGGGKGFIPNGVTTIKKAAFSNNGLLDYVRIPDSVTKIENYAFVLSSISYVELSSGLKSVGDFAFGRCANLYIADFSHLSHAPYMTSQAFRDSRLLKPIIVDKDKDVFEATFLHSNPNTMAIIADELAAIDDTWGTMADQFFSKSFNQLPSFICINKLSPNHASQIEFHLTSLTAYSSNTYNYIIDNDPKTSTKSSWSTSTSTSVQADQEKYSSSLKSFCTMSFVRSKANLPTSFTPIFSDESKEYIPFGSNAEDIVFIKYFGNYSQFEADKYAIPANTFINLTALKHFGFAECVDTGKDFVNGKLDVIEQGAFKNTGLVSIDLPSTLTLISEGAFQDCCDLKDLNFEPNKYVKPGMEPEYLVLKPYAFAGDAKIEELNLPWYIDFDAKEESPVGNPFIGCTSLKKIDVALNPMFTPKVRVHGMYPGCIMHETGKRLITCVNNFSYLSSITSENRSFGFYSTLDIEYLTVDIANYGNNGMEYAFAYSPAKKITLLNSQTEGLIAKSYMFANCKNLEVLDLSNLVNPLELDATAHDLFFNPNPDYKVWVKDESSISTYANILHIDSSHIIVKPSSAI